MPTPISTTKKSFIDCSCGNLPEQQRTQLENLTLIVAMSALKKSLIEWRDREASEIKHLREDNRDLRTRLRKYEKKEFEEIMKRDPIGNLEKQVDEAKDKLKLQILEKQKTVERYNTISTVAVSVCVVAFFFFIAISEIFKITNRRIF